MMNVVPSVVLWLGRVGGKAECTRAAAIPTPEAEEKNPSKNRRLAEERESALPRCLARVLDERRDISFAPGGARARWGADFPTARAVGYDLSLVSKTGF
jgi:hypothetical protein